MGQRWSKEKVLFLVATALFVCVMLKLALFLGQRPTARGAPKVPVASIQPGDPDVRDRLAVPPIARYLAAGDPFFRHPTRRPHDKVARGDEAEADEDAAGGGAEDGAKGDEAKEDEAGAQARRQETKHGGEDKLREDQEKGKKGDERKQERLPPPPPAGRPPLKLVAVVGTEGPEALRQAVLRHEVSGEYYRVFIGDVLFEELRLDDITDDSAVLVDARGRRHTFRGRFEDKYDK